jgi:hypothetical protein
MVDEEEDLLQVGVVGTSSPGEVVCLTNTNTCTKAVAEVETTIMIAVVIMAKVVDQTPTTTTTITISTIKNKLTSAGPTETMKTLAIIIIILTRVGDHTGD